MKENDTKVFWEIRDEDKRVYMCPCGGEIMVIGKTNEDPDVAISIFRCQKEYSIMDKLRHIWKIIKTGMPYYDDMFLRQEDFEDFRKFINQIPSNYKTVINNEEKNDNNRKK